MAEEVISSATPSLAGAALHHPPEQPCMQRSYELLSCSVGPDRACTAASLTKAWLLAHAGKGLGALLSQLCAAAVHAVQVQSLQEQAALAAQPQAQLVLCVVAPVQQALEQVSELRKASGIHLQGAWPCAAHACASAPLQWLCRQLWSSTYKLATSKQTCGASQPTCVAAAQQPGRCAR